MSDPREEFESSLERVALGIDRLKAERDAACAERDRLEHVEISLREIMKQHGAELKRVSELGSFAGGTRNERDEHVEHLNNRIEQLLSTCEDIGVEMSRDGYGRNVAADQLRETLKATAAALYAERLSVGQLRSALRGLSVGARPEDVGPCFCDPASIDEHTPACAGARDALSGKEPLPCCKRIGPALSEHPIQYCGLPVGHLEDENDRREHMAAVPTPEKE